MNTRRNKNKFITLIRDWIAPVLYVIVTVFLAPILYDYFVTLKPNVQKIDNNIEGIMSSMKEIENRYTKRDENGIDCKVGFSNEISGNNIVLPENNKFGLKGADKIYITNPYSIFNTTMMFIVNLIEFDSKNPSKCDVFISKEAIEKLDIKKNDLCRGIFSMKMRTEKKEQQSN